MIKSSENKNHEEPKSLLNTLTRSLVFGLIVVCFACAVQAQDRISIIPRPRQVTANGERFPLSGAHIALADARSVEDRFAATDFIADLKEEGISLKIRGGRDRKAILIGLIGSPPVRKALMAKVKGTAIVDLPDLGDEAYILQANANGVVIAGGAAAGVFYGLQTLKQLVRGQGADAFIQGVDIYDVPAMRWRGVSDDVSRGPVPTVNYIKRQLRTFAAYKLNLHSFYMEQTFASSAHPLIGPEGGSLTPDEIRELVAYAKSYHIELVPEQQTFGHLHKALKLEKYAPLAETPYGDVLSPQQEGTYALIADWYRELDQLFPGRFFHIGADETFELGQGQSREAARTRGVGAVYFEHLNRVHDLLKPYNRKLIFWGDIALNHPDLIGSIPKDLIVANWDYAPRDSYAARIDPFRNAGLQQLVCPGVWGWNQIFPNVDNASQNIINFVRDGQAAGAIGMLNTTWDDDGETLFEMSWYGIVLGAAASWQNGAVDQTRFDADFDWALFRNDGDQFVKAIHALGSVNTVLGVRTTDDLFWRDPFTASFQKEARANAGTIRQMRLQVETALEDLLRNRQRARRNATMIPAMILAAQRLDHLGRRAETVEKLSREYWDAYLNLGDRARVRPLRRYYSAIYNQLREMAEELSALRASYREQWLAENRPYWLDSILARYDNAISLWLNKSRALEEAVRNYETTSILPNPEEFGLGPRP
ncbi:MAG TPA: family 20 glycosylhydrolase [Pyrinomonadaceae bacterium]|nr:family 20 glycosylhydrolase [Pyrinomonadaceae bacterium]